MKNLTILFFLFSLTANAQNQGVQVFVVDKYIDSSTLEKKYQVTRKPQWFNNLPKRAVREEFFQDVNLPASWDELSKDIFYMDLQSKKLNELIVKYPEFKDDELKRLKGKHK